MSEELSGLQWGLATVSADGLWFQNRIFLNNCMVRSGWLEHAKIEGCWQIPVLYSISDPNCVYLLEMNTLEVATAFEKNTLN